jgi:hypothetical protein
MSILSVWNGYADFKVIDDATRAEIAGFTWVDDVRLEYEAYVLPARYGCNGGLATEIVKVSAVSVNHAAREIHVNTPQPIMLTVTVGAPVRAVRACTECRQEETCRRIDYCAAYRCGFGRDEKP